ncbi:hypothetical protein TraAM80_03215 [Trypanosoma rangeli]|uniref:Uncharacterized protein n=1 Tax=Trypanosoma rangeli TaxID=5698 RepID=A0A422NQE0_TRYRA|nr:uncharacterized protein TraAM80_03215 [Trypanosoma rangeli]RNF07693.1 hypothetical protein TraAM80_03215 [Trypanosoma rangeli]|eukprot:RNF07693.1 hypothetical protein TraAM80_03215 [Trypanosoma rangeli]
MPVAKTEPRRELPPHPPPNMLDLFMTRYDYDYNRDIESRGLGDGTSGGDAVSGDVRNRPIFRFAHSSDGVYDTTYLTDYVRHNRDMKDMSGLLQTACGEHDVTSAFVRDHYLPELAKHATATGAHPISVYKTDYQNSGPVASGKPTLYAGARTVAFNSDFLLIPPTEEELKADSVLPPKITSKESLLLKGYPSEDRYRPPKEDLFASRRSQLTTMGGPPTDYYCNSWVYGDKSLAYPSQLPRSIEQSPNAHLIGTMDDKAALLALLAGKKRAAGKPYPMPDETNPILIQRIEQPFCGITRRIENEGYVNMSTYQSDHIHQGVLPELPDTANLAGNGAGDIGGERRLACAGEMMAGTLTRRTKKAESLRNSHGNLLKEKPDSRIVDLHTWKQMKSIEKRIAVDKADPHRHKLH